MEWYIILLLIAAGTLVGFINALAGSGSVITLPLLIFLGLPANVANGTNRIAILMQNIVGVRGYHKQKKVDTKHGLTPSITAIIGAIIGANIAVEINADTTQKIIGVVMVIMFFIIIYKPGKWVNGKTEIKSQNIWFQIPVFFLLGIYGGIIQIGAGVFFLSALVLNAGYDVVRANALKLLIILIYTPFALAMFIMNDQVNWIYGILLGTGTMLGAHLATKHALDWDPKYIRYILLTMISLSALKLFGIFEFVISLF